MDEIIKTAFVQFRTKNGHVKADELIRKHGGTALGNLPHENWPAFAVDLGITDGVSLEHFAKGRRPESQEELSAALNAMAPAAFAKFNSAKRSGES
jgi:hypothetical protein